MGGSSEIQSCVVRTVKCTVDDEYTFDDTGWTEEWQGDFWRSLGEICLWPSFIIVVVLMIVGLSKLLTDLYLSSMSNKDEKSEVAPKTQQSAEKSDYVDTFNNDNQEYDRDGIYDFEHTITFGPIKK